MTEADRFDRSAPPRPVALAVFGLALVLSGVLILDLAFSGAIFGRVVTHAWVAGVVGLLLLVPGAAVVGYAVSRALTVRRNFYC